MSTEDGTARIEIPIKGMGCQGCAAELQDTLENTEGIESSQVSVGKAVVVYQRYLITEEDIERTIEKKGYQIDTKGTGKKKGFIDRMIESNEKTFGNKRLDCCDL